MQGQQVKHFQHGDGVVVTYVNNDVVHVQFGDKVRMMSGDNLFNLDGRPFITPPPAPPSFDAVVEAERRARRLILSRREYLREQSLEAKITHQQFVDALLNTDGYILRLDTNEAGIEAAQDEYIEWAGESFPEEHIRIDKSRPRSQDRRWRFDFFDLRSDETFREYPFPVILMGSQEKAYARLHNGQVRGLWHGGTISMHYTSEVEKLVRLGLRAR